jgi:hypothetical protein
VSRPDDAEVTAVDGRDLGDAEALGGGDDLCVDGAERQGAMHGHEFGDA